MPRECWALRGKGAHGQGQGARSARRAATGVPSAAGARAACILRTHSCHACSLPHRSRGQQGGGNDAGSEESEEAAAPSAAASSSSGSGGGEGPFRGIAPALKSAGSFVQQHKGAAGAAAAAAVLAGLATALVRLGRRRRPAKGSTADAPHVRGPRMARAPAPGAANGAGRTGGGGAKGASAARSGSGGGSSSTRANAAAEPRKKSAKADAPPPKPGPLAKLKPTPNCGGYARRAALHCNTQLSHERLCWHACWWTLLS